jgi:hypothetical protein
MPIAMTHVAKIVSVLLAEARASAPIDVASQPREKENAGA